MSSVPALAITTSVKPQPAVEALAKTLAEELDAPQILRRNSSLKGVFAEISADHLLIVGADRLRLHDRDTGVEYFYHPNLFLTRGSMALRGEPDPFLAAAALAPGDRVLDCTLGFASEGALAALMVGDPGTVVGLESEPALAAVTRIGLQTFPVPARPLEAALRRVQVVCADYRAYLESCPSGAFDVVYFDPFFPERLAGSEASVSPLFLFGNPAPLSAEAVTEARRVARRRVVVKHPRAVSLPPPLAGEVSETVSSRKSRVVYSLFLP